MPSKSQALYTEAVTKEEHVAIKALYDGDANSYQQKLCLKLICGKFSRMDDLLYVPGSVDETAFLAGRGFVGQRIIKYINLPTSNTEE